MKKFYQIFIIIFVVLSLFIIKDDIKSAIDKVYSYLNKNNQSLVINLIEKKEVQLPGKVDTPGALRVVNNFLNINSNIILSKDNVIKLTNKERYENGNLPLLTENQKLDLSAEKKLQDMFTSQYFEHVSPKGIGVGDLGEEVGYEYILIGENLALGNFKDDLSLVDAWMASVGHRANILNEHYTEIGVAVGKGNFEGKDIWMAVQHFGTPRSICPIIDQVLFGVIGLDQNKIKEMEENLTLRLDMINKRVLYEGMTYSEQINTYNSLINTYNNLIKDIKQKINDYNNQIRAFNLCISNNQ
ncbi:MAG: CAP domain-containing protein [Candidatus Paceibacterota bacterium]